MTEIKRYTPVPPISAADDPTDPLGVAQMTERLKSLAEKDDYANSETTEFFSNLNAVALGSPSNEKTELIKALLDCNLVEVTQKIWRNGLSPDLFETVKQSLPSHLHKSLQAMWDLSDKSTPTCERIVKVDLHADLLKCLSWDTLSAASLNESKWNAKRDLVKALNGVLHNVVRRAGTARAAFRRCNAVDVLQKLRNVNNYPVISRWALMIQSYLVTEDDNERLNSNQEVFQWLISVLDCAVAGKPWHGYRFAVIELLEAINNLAATDENKLKIVKAGALPHYVKLLSQKRDAAEQKEAAHGLWMLAFKCKDEIVKQDGCLEESAQKGGGHVMISYNWGSQSTVLQLRDRLKAAGFNIWIDVEHMTDSLLESKACAVEEASVVLLCLSEKYKDSPNCRTEAEYAFNSQKRIVALQLEDGYTPDGWLGPLCRNNLYYDFSAQAKFDDEWNRLHAKLAELNLSAGGQTARKSAVDVSKWKTSDVHNWLEKNKLKHMQQWFKDYDGEMLEEFINLQQQVPDAYYQALLKNDVSMTDLIRINCAIKRLFDPESVVDRAR